MLGHPAELRSSTQAVSSASICSSDLSLVSGNRRQTKMKPAMQILAYNQNVPCAPRYKFRYGNVNVRTVHAVHKASTATDTAAPRIRFGKISEITTQVTGASDIA